ncbi:MAG: hypothetical protein KGL39_52700 [Patescibacteria group bacterium]|nr:hypothetical protein [Patescibacteria group bacterium]
MLPTASTSQVSAIINPYLSQLQAMYGSFDPNNVQTRRRSYYSFLAYPTAGQSVFQFFGATIGTANRQLTNIQRSGHLDNPLIVKALRTRYFITSQANNTWSGTDASTLFSDIVNGLFTVGVLRMVISSKEWMQLPSPFQYAPAAYGIPEVYTSGTAGAATVSHGPYAYPGSGGKDAAYLVDPQFLIGSDQNFAISIEYPSGVVPVIGTGVVTGNTVLYIGIELDGIEIRPLQ